MVNVRSWLVVGTFLFGLVVCGSAQAIESKSVLTLDMAKKIADACESLQQEKVFAL